MENFEQPIPLLKNFWQVTYEEKPSTYIIETKRFNGNAEFYSDKH